MPAETKAPTLVDWVVIALSPALVMLMVGSLVFFLVEVLYAGQYSDRLLYTLFFFVIGAVLIARISIEQGSMKARMYGLGLGLATFIALQTFVSYPKGTQFISPVINLFLIAIVWWSANKLTWDCTHLDEDRKSSGRGILVAAGLDGPTPTNAAESRAREKQGETDGDDEADVKAEAKKRKKDPVGVLGWMARWDRFRETQRKKPHTPGTWIVYFSLAAFPLFGLGQSLIPADDVARRRATFLQMAVYVGSGLMLLVTTSLLGLRKYLRERNANIPPAMTMGWLGLGAALIAMFLVVGAVLPRPHSETPLINLPRAGKDDRGASKYAQKTDDGSAGKGEGKAGQKQEAGADAKQSGKNGEKGGNAGEKGDGGGKGKDKGGKEKGDDKNGEQQNNAQGNNAKQQDNPDKQDGKPGDQKDNKAEGDREAKNADGKAEDRDRSDGGNESSSGAVSKAMQAVGSFIKWVVWIVIAVLVVVGLFVFFLKYLAPFTAWAQGLLDWLRGLFARKERVRTANKRQEEAVAEVEDRPPPFSEFPNPFDDGSAKRMTLTQLIEYSFSAFESWAWEQDMGRTPDETPNEFAARIGGKYADFDEDGRKLANLYVRTLYSTQPLPAVEAIKTLQAFWRSVESAGVGA
ncbi:DUF4129 domain-containing protein [Limnoglobus roseus]|uniref:Protein-glutamine gamma-glutamyltransferase-like C-terminal domain-containing protein n=1 Tax=Limnoglobus roseus TaxID=2598579 RepID=A0A5C1AGP9_9BACT|nr:DUF4129 domain-containing protein [Limnoglobus roseus]QEL18000.1 hypothetical protein PX52LOC_05014 [Limnoglobus roseus]